MNLHLCLLSLCLGLSSAAPRMDPDLTSHWQLWKSWHLKNYHEVSVLFFPAEADCCHMGICLELVPWGAKFCGSLATS